MLRQVEKHQIVFLSDWHELNRWYEKLHQSQRGCHQVGGWSAMFGMDIFKRHEAYRAAIVEHMTWVVNEEFPGWKRWRMIDTDRRSHHTCKAVIIYYTEDPADAEAS